MSVSTDTGFFLQRYHRYYGKKKKKRIAKTHASSPRTIVNSFIRKQIFNSRRKIPVGYCGIGSERRDCVRIRKVRPRMARLAERRVQSVSQLRSAAYFAERSLREYIYRTRALHRELEFSTYSTFRMDYKRVRDFSVRRNNAWRFCNA